MEAVLPKNVNYLDTLPKAIPSERKRRNYFAANGTQYRCGQQIRIEINDPRCFLDPVNSFLRLTLTNSNAAAICSLDFGGASSIIQNFRVEQAGNIIMNIQNYNRLYCGIIAPTTGGKNWRSVQSVYGQGLYFGTSNQAGAATTNVVAVAGELTGDRLCSVNCPLNNNSVLEPGGGQAQVCIPLVGGLFSQSKLIPLPMLNEPIQLVFDLEGVEDIGSWSAQPVNTDILISNVRYCAELVEVPRDVLGFLSQQQAAHGGALVIQGSSYESQSTILPQLATGTQILEIPSRKRSIKSIQFVCMADPSTIADFAATAGSGLPAGSGGWNAYSKSASQNPMLVSYQLRAGSLVMPPTAIRGPGGREPAGTVQPHAGSATIAGLPDQFHNVAESISEVSKAIGHEGTMLGVGSLCSLTYANNRFSTGCNWVQGQGQAGVGLDSIVGPTGVDGAVVVGQTTGNAWSFTPFMIDLEAYQNQAIDSGLDTKTLSLQMQLHLELDNTLSAGGTGVGAGGQSTPINVDIFTHHDIMYYFNSNGTITFSD